MPRDPRRRSPGDGKKKPARSERDGSPAPDTGLLTDDDEPTLVSGRGASDDDETTLDSRHGDSLPGPSDESLHDAPTMMTAHGGDSPDDAPTMLTGVDDADLDEEAPTMLTGVGHGGTDPDAPTMVSGAAGPPPAGRSIPRTRPSERPPPEIIGNYRLLKKLGEGGMGEVWKAAQIEPVRRKVALKIIKKGMDTHEVVGRFEQERQALAVMDHPAIAKVFDAGETPRGRPYFVMEYVRGVPVNEHCDRRRLPIRERLELFMQVCEGVQHAHQKAIIHRDIKPGNVLVTFQDGKAEPKIIDFGVAKATTQEMSDRTMYTELGQMLGTPAYMSPEQATMTGEGIDTRTDVYALGVLLYVLLVGALPFDPKELENPTFDEVRRNIIEVDPPTPSTRMRKLDERRSAFSGKCRGTEPKALASQLTGDLDWICMKALEKDRARRYGSPAELAADIERYLKDEPVLATPPSRTYLTRKFVKRHKAGVAAAAVGVATLAVFAVTMTIQAGRIAAERDRANQEAETALQVSDFLIDLFEVSAPSESLGNTITAREILDRGAYEIRQELRDQPLVQARLMDTIGEVYKKLGLYGDARPLLEEALLTFERTAEDNPLDMARSLERLATLLVRVSEYDTAAGLYDRALAILREEYQEEHPDLAKIIGGLGTLAFRQGDFAAARERYEESRAIVERTLGPDHPRMARSLTNLAILARRTGDNQEARMLYEDALGIQERAYGREHPDVAQTLNNLGWLLLSMGEYDAARRSYERALAIGEKILGSEHADVASSLNNLAVLHERTGDYREARRLHERALAIRETALGPDHQYVAQSLGNLGNAMKFLGDYDAARSLLERSLATAERALSPDHPRVALYGYNLATLIALQGDRERALELLGQAVERGFANAYMEEDPDLDSLREDPRFEALLETVRARLAD